MNGRREERGDSERQKDGGRDYLSGLMAILPSLDLVDLSTSPCDLSLDNIDREIASAANMSRRSPDYAQGRYGGAGAHNADERRQGSAWRYHATNTSKREQAGISLIVPAIYGCVQRPMGKGKRCSGAE
jgi:hypothetical protein